MTFVLLYGRGAHYVEGTMMSPQLKLSIYEVERQMGRRWILKPDELAGAPDGQVFLPRGKHGGWVDMDSVAIVAIFESFDDAKTMATRLYDAYTDAARLCDKSSAPLLAAIKQANDTLELTRELRESVLNEHLRKIRAEYPQHPS